MPKLEIDSTPNQGKYWSEKGYNVVTVDVLRATSTIITALASNATEVIPCAEVEEARDYASKPDYLLAGERKGEIIPGFDFTNSPYDLSNIDLSNKKIVLTTSDGTKLITSAMAAKNVLIGSTLNYEFLAQIILGLSGDWAIIGAGSSGDFRPEDKVGCALIAGEVAKNGNYDLSSEIKDFISYYSYNWQSHVLNSLSSEKLRKINRDVDIEFVIDEANKHDIAPSAKKYEGYVSITK